MKLFRKRKEKGPSTPQTQNAGDSRAPPPQPGPYPPSQGCTTPYFPPITPFPWRFEYQQEYPHGPAQPLAPFHGGPFPIPSQVFAPSPPPPSSNYAGPNTSPMPFTPEQLARFSPEQCSQILEWSQASSSWTPSSPMPTPLVSPPQLLSELAPVEQTGSPSVPARVPTPQPAPTPLTTTVFPAAPQAVKNTPPESSQAPPPSLTPLASKSSFTPSVLPSDESKRKDESANLLKEQANRLFEKKDFEGAITYYSLALDYSPENAIVLANRSSAYLSTNPPNLDGALKDAKSATEKDPSYWKGWSRLGQCLLEKRDAAGAKKALEKALALGGGAVGAPTKRALRCARAMLCDEEESSSSSRTTQQAPSQTPAPAANPARRQSTPAAPSTRPTEPQPTANNDRIFDTPATSNANDPGLPSYTPSLNSSDPSIRALNAQALAEQLTAVTNHLKTKNKGAVSLRALVSAASVNVIQVVYNYMATTELTTREIGNTQPLHASFAAMWVSPAAIPGNTFLDMDMESSSFYTGKVPGTVGINGYSEEFRAAKLPPRLNLMLCNYDPLPVLSTDTVLSRLILTQCLPTLAQAETELRQLLGPRRQTSLLYLTTWQTQIEDLCYALNRNEPSTFVDFSTSRNVSNNALGSTGQTTIGLNKFLYQMLLGAELFQRLLKEPPGTSYVGLITDPVSALLVLADQWMKNVDVTKGIATDLAPLKYFLVSRVHHRQVEGLIKFAEMIKWPYMDEARRYIENAYNELISGQLHNFDMTDWLFGLVQPGHVFRQRIMSALVWACATTRQYQSPPFYDSGLVLPSRSYWPQRTVLGRVLGGLTNPKSTCGWVGPVAKPQKDITGWVVVTARQVEFPEPCFTNPGEDDGLAAVLNGATGASAEDALRELVNIQDWIVPAFPLRAQHVIDSQNIIFKNLNLEDLPRTSTGEQQYRAILDFEINSSLVSYTLYSNPLFVSAHPCVGTHVMHKKDIQKYTKNIVRVSGLKDTFVSDSELLVIDATGKTEELVARAWCSERARHAVIRRLGCCFACALQMAAGPRGLGLNVLIWS